MPDSRLDQFNSGDIGSDITGFFQSFSSLEANPANSALRESVLSTASTLATDISNAANGGARRGQDWTSRQPERVRHVNALRHAIAQLDTRAQSISPDADAGTLRRSTAAVGSKPTLAVGPASTSHRRKTTASPLPPHRAIVGLQQFELPVDDRIGGRGNAILQARRI